MTAKFLIPFTLAALAGCGGETTSDFEPVVPEARFASIYAEVLSPSCASFASCHSSVGKAGGCDLSPMKAYGALVGTESVQAPGKTLVVAGDPDASFLVAKLRGHLEEGEGDRMPLGNPPLSEAQILAIEAWIAAGALND